MTFGMHHVTEKQNHRPKPNVLADENKLSYKQFVCNLSEGCENYLATTGWQAVNGAYIKCRQCSKTHPMSALVLHFESGDTNSVMKKNVHFINAHQIII